MKRALIIAALASLATGLLPATAASATTQPMAPSAHDLTWQLTSTGVTARLRGLSVISRRIAWASGSAGTVLRTTDGGRTWQNVSPPGVTDLQFRDIEAFDANTAVILSIGEGEASRVYRTTDGGAHWTETFRNTEPLAFYDCLAFFDRRHGLALSDPVGGKFRVLSTSDGGASWAVLPNDGMPPALEGEFAFAASGQCITVSGGRDAWIATGGGAQARVLHSRDRGLHWTGSVTPMASSPSAGVFAVAFRDRHTGVAVGGDFANPTNGVDALAFTRDGARSWVEPMTAPQGYRSGVTWHPWFPTVLIAVGPTGSDLTLDAGRHWHQFDAGSFDTVGCAHDGACWASGEQGRVATLQLS
ncbi:MAG TPA: oxidoreductase [Actinophytocola sp.]|uniref:WD40/YVTN/BNR-like repeat-containing protein n=1 Tax=Actinophytocola sp. TaxID=1872138 RepID=UPI002DBC0531|nr:oxidoreductase [Actinophytocola sp.]HEU5471364.1 oxidoreductase [Actinophytocola sp.]